MKSLVHVLATAVGKAPWIVIVAAVLILPSMLVLWDRWHRARGGDPLTAKSS